MYVYIYTCLYIYVIFCAYIYIYVYMCVYIYSIYIIHTHLQQQWGRLLATSKLANGCGQMGGGGVNLEPKLLHPET